MAKEKNRVIKKKENNKEEHNKETNTRLIFAYVMATVGFILILINAIGYIFNLDIKNTALVVIGIVFVAIGTLRVRKIKEKKK